MSNKTKIISHLKAPARRPLPANWQKFKNVMEEHDWEVDTYSTGQPFFLACGSKEANACKLICRENKVKVRVDIDEDLGTIFTPTSK